MIDDETSSHIPANRPVKEPPGQSTPVIVATLLCFVVLIGISLWSHRGFLRMLVGWITGSELSERGLVGLVVGLTVMLAAILVYGVNHHPDR